MKLIHVLSEMQELKMILETLVTLYAEGQNETQELFNLTDDLIYRGYIILGILTTIQEGNRNEHFTISR